MNIFIGYEFWVDCSFLSVFKSFVPIVSDLYGVWWKVHYYLNCFLYRLVIISFLPFSRFFFFFKSNIQKFDYAVSWYIFLWVYPVFGLLNFLDLFMFGFCRLGKFSATISLIQIHPLSPPFLGLWWHKC